MLLHTLGAFELLRDLSALFQRYAFVPDVLYGIRDFHSSAFREAFGKTKNAPAGWRPPDRMKARDTIAPRLYSILKTAVSEAMRNNRDTRGTIMSAGAQDKKKLQLGDYLLGMPHGIFYWVPL